MSDIKMHANIKPYNNHHGSLKDKNKIHMYISLIYKLKLSTNIIFISNNHLFGSTVDLTALLYHQAQSNFHWLLAKPNDLHGTKIVQKYHCN